MATKTVNLQLIRKNKEQLLKTLAAPYVEVFRVLMSDENIIKATKFISPSLVIRLVRRTYDKKVNKHGNIEVSLTIGKPNYLEREFVADCKKAKVPFPVRNIQVKYQK